MSSLQTSPPQPALADTSSSARSRKGKGGRPKGSTRVLAGKLSNVLLGIQQLTGLSWKSLHPLLIENPVFGDKLGKIRSMQSALKPLAGGRQAAPIPKRTFPVVKHCELRLHAVSFASKPNIYWVVLCGYERRTHFVNCRLYEVVTRPPGEKQSVGRQRKALAQPPQAWISGTDNNLCIQLAPELLLDFINDTRFRMGVPLTHVWLSRSVAPKEDAVSALKKAAGAQRMELEFARNPVHRFADLPERMEITLEQLHQKLREGVNWHNRTQARGNLNKMKVRLQAALNNLQRDAALQEQLAKVGKTTRKFNAQAIPIDERTNRPVKGLALEQHLARIKLTDYASHFELNLEDRIALITCAPTALRGEKQPVDPGKN